MFTAIVNSLAPVFLVITLGWTLKRRAFLSVQALGDLNRLTYWVGLPCLLFYKLTTITPVFTAVGDLLLVTVAATGMGIILGIIVARWLGIPGTVLGTFVQAAFRGNLAFVGLPVVIYAFVSSGEGVTMAEATTVLVLGPLVVVYNVASVLALLLSGQQFDKQALRKVLIELVSNPLLIACVAGVVYAGMDGPMPLWLQRSLNAIGQMALPLALICIGGSLAMVRLQGSLAWSASAAVIKVVVIPLIGYALAWLVGLSPQDTRIALILLACPTAAASYVLARQLGGDETLASGAILISTLLAALSLAVILAMT